MKMFNFPLLRMFGAVVISQFLKKPHILFCDFSYVCTFVDLHHNKLFV
jgi:hypothetical protein